MNKLEKIEAKYNEGKRITKKDVLWLLNYIDDLENHLDITEMLHPEVFDNIGWKQNMIETEAEANQVHDDILEAQYGPKEYWSIPHTLDMDDIAGHKG